VLANMHCEHVSKHHVTHEARDNKHRNFFFQVSRRGNHVPRRIASPTLCVCVCVLLSALQGRQYILKVLEQAAIRSKESIRAGKEPSCLLDFWTQQILTECDEAAAAGVPPPKYSHNKEMAYTVMDFLFASQVSCWVPRAAVR